VPSFLPLPPDVNGIDATHKTVVVIDTVGLVYVNGVGTYATIDLHDNGRVGEGGQVVDWLFVLLHTCPRGVEQVLGSSGTQGTPSCLRGQSHTIVAVHQEVLHQGDAGEKVDKKQEPMGVAYVLRELYHHVVA